MVIADGVWRALQAPCHQGRHPRIRLDEQNHAVAPAGQVAERLRERLGAHAAPVEVIHSLLEGAFNRGRGHAVTGADAETPDLQAGAPQRGPLERKPHFRNVPRSSSSNAWRNSCCVFITMGPYHATGSTSGFPETSRKRTPSSPACISISSPRSKSTSERFVAAVGGFVSAHPTASVGTASGPEALQNLPSPKKTYAKAWRLVSTGSVLLRRGGTDTSR